MALKFNPLSGQFDFAPPSSFLQVNNQTSNYTLVATDNNKVIVVTTAIPSLVILPNNIPVGFECFLVQGGIGVLQFQQATGAGLNSFTGNKKLAGINATLHLSVLANSDGNSAVWQVLRGDTISGAIAVLPNNFTLLLGHNFYDPTTLTVSGSNVTAASGTGGTATQVSAGSSTNNYPATKLTRGSGLTAIQGGGLNVSSGITLSSYTDYTQIFLGYQVYSGNTLQNFNILGSFYNASGNTTLAFENGWTVNSGAQLQNASPSASFATRHQWEDQNVHLIVITRNSGVVSIYVDGVLAGTGTFNYALSGTGILYNQYQAGGASAISGNMALMQAGFYGRGISASEVAQIDAYYQALFNQDYKPPSLLSSTDLWIYNSNSIGQGFSYGNANTPSAQMVKALANNYSKNITRWYNISLGGISTTQMITDAPTYVDPFLVQKSGSAKVNLILHEGTNDIFLNNATGAQAYANLKSYWQGRKAAGVDRVFIGTVLPRTAFSSAQNQARTDCNTLIRNSAVSTDGATAIIDFDTNSNLMDATNTTYYSDGTHPTLIGAGQMASTLATALNTYI